MKRGTLTISFNKKWAKTKGKAKFVEHFKNTYPGVDLSAEYDKIVPPAPAKAEKDKKED